MNNFNGNKKKKGIMSILLPYLVCFGLVMLVVFFFRGSSGGEVSWNQLTLTEVVEETATQLENDEEVQIDFQKVSATYPSSQPTLITVTGSFEAKNKKGDWVNYTFEIQYNTSITSESDLYDRLEMA